jgi:hypothetical protein
LGALGPSENHPKQAASTVIAEIISKTAQARDTKYFTRELAISCRAPGNRISYACKDSLNRGVLMVMLHRREVEGWGIARL